MNRRQVIQTISTSIGVGVATMAAPALATEAKYTRQHFTTWSALVEAILALSERRVFQADAIRKPIEDSSIGYVVLHAGGALEAAISVQALREDNVNIHPVVLERIRTSKGRCQLAASLCSEPTYPICYGGLNVGNPEKSYAELLQIGG